MSRAARRRAASALALGTTVAGRYRLDAKLGEGGMAQVFRAEDLASGRKVAVKVLHADVAANPEAVERTKREGQVLSELDNPAIVSVETFGELEDGAVFLVMELLEGETLGERMRRGTLEPVELAPIVAGTCAGLHAAHARGIVHRDLKPDNVFLCPTEHGLQVKLLDFGISKVYGSQKLTQTGEILGTPRYMSPEQLGAEPDIDARVDVYALGVILYEALAGKPPFLATTPTDLVIAILHGKVAPLRAARPDAPEAVEAVVMRALSKVRGARYDTAMELAEAYIDAVGGPAAVRNQQRRGMATRAFGGMRTAPVAPPPGASGEASAARPQDPGSPRDLVPETRPPPASGAADAVVGSLRLGTFSGFAEAAAPAPQEATKGSKRTAAMGASPGAAIPASPGPPVPGRMVEEERPELARTERAMPATRSPEDPGPGQVVGKRAMPKTRETPAGMGDELEPDELRSSAVPTSHARPGGARADASSSGAPSSAPSGAGSSGRRVAPTEMMDASHPSLAPARRSEIDAPPATRSARHAPAARPRRRPPSRVGKVQLVIGALLAGAASAAAVIGGMQYLEEREEPADDDPTDGTSNGATPTEATPPAEDTGSAATEGGEPTGAEVAEGDGTGGERDSADGADETAARGAPADETADEADPTDRAAETASETRRETADDARDEAEAGRRRRPPIDQTPNDRAPDDEAPDERSADERPSTPYEAIQMARAAQRGGDPEGCVRLLDDAIRSGAPPIALRYRGDCYESAGRRADAVRDYQRFCRIAHDNPAITEVRPLLEGWGRSCP